VDACGGTADGLLARSVAWDFALIAAYVLALGLIAVWVGHRARGRASLAALGGAVLALVCGVLDACENLGILFVLDGASGIVAVKAILAYAKWVALGGSVALIGGAYLVHRTAKEPPEPLPWAFPPQCPEILTCDLVMKGGITSGVVYPGAVYALARRYRIKNIGGSSAGAIAAAVTAAAEYRRLMGGGNDGFEALKKATAGLTAEDRLFGLFQPAPACAPLFDVAAAALRPGGGAVRLLSAAWTAAAVFPAATALAIVSTLGAALVVTNGISPAATARVFAAAAPGGVLLWVAAVLVEAWWTAKRALPSNGFGLCPGPGQRGRTDGLSDWLADTVDQLAFGDTWRTDGPLTLGHLWRGAPQAGGAPEDRKINLEVLTTSLTHGRPYRIPFDLRLWFRPKELEAVLPKRVVAAMVKASAKVEAGKRDPPLPPGLLPLPVNEDLPVVLLARMSLSFPGLLSATHLHGLRWSFEEGGPSVDDTGESEPTGTATRGEYVDHWFSDGGISSNFPIHFFDQALPRWPTFGLDLGELTEGRERIELARDNNDGVLARWIPVTDTGSFLGALKGSLHAWMDNLQKRSPGYRDRVACINLDEAEGGLNLRMPGDLVARIAGYGYDAGLELGARFDSRGRLPGDPEPRPVERKQGQAWPWNNHRWIRYRSTVALLQGLLHRMASTYRLPETSPVQGHAALLEGQPPSYPLTGAQRADATALTNDLLAAHTGDGRSLTKGAPKPLPELRSVPKV
jgi:predicted acylesterase/phospholipase RssA